MLKMIGLFNLRNVIGFRLPSARPVVLLRESVGKQCNSLNSEWLGDGRFQILARPFTSRFCNLKSPVGPELGWSFSQTRRLCSTSEGIRTNRTVDEADIDSISKKLENDDQPLNIGNENSGEQVICNDYLSEDNLDLFREIADGDESVYDDLRNINMILQVTSNFVGVTVNLSKEDWINMLKMKMALRKKYIKFRVVSELKRLKRERLKLETDLKLETKLRLESSGNKPWINTNATYNFDDPCCFHNDHNTIIVATPRYSLKNISQRKLFRSMMYSNEIFIDCSYQDYMNRFNTQRLGKQLGLLLSLHKSEINPYHIVFCNFDKENLLGSIMPKYQQRFYDETFPVTITEKSYLDLCNHEDLVYLTPHCREELIHWDPNKRYIIGAYVDMTDSKHISLAKGKKFKLKMAKLPLDRYLKWEKGSKNLPVNTVYSIMVRLKDSGGDWESALKVIPQRHLIPHSDSAPKPVSKISEFIKNLQIPCDKSNANY